MRSTLLLRLEARRAFATFARPEITPQPLYWRNIPKWSESKNIVEPSRLFDFLSTTVPETIPSASSTSTLTRHELIDDITAGIKKAPMSVRITPHLFSSIDWQAPLQDPIFHQLIPLSSRLEEDHPKLDLDPLHESADMPIPGLVHRYPDKALFLTTAVCPVYCRFCTRSYAIGSPTPTVSKQRPWKASKRREGALIATGSKQCSWRVPSYWESVFEYLQDTAEVNDVVISGGDTFYLQPEHLRYIGERLLEIPHIRRFRFASKGLAVCPSRFLDPADDWASTLIDLSRSGRSYGKEVALHTHFNHPKEITWITRLAAQRLFANGLIVRNQSVLLRGINDDVNTMSTLIRQLADINIQPMYVYQADMVKGTEDMRTPLSTALYLENRIRGTIAGHKMPAFVVDLPGGGGKRLVTSFETYDPETGISTFKAPGVKGDKIFSYYDPLRKTG
ncbi:hypothetical protein AMS68_003053 [Peltaster fructicola]|uniref:Radical SAM core domain-containing protein n=1 Tax=Peltaster fructicola TaxID=286661 RepID=A0A6H0XS69_9PEZI|nr:hypothetical protein AMS68_003053 [Peltaster fructicola]